ncbi:putative lytic transglycosylase, catalytic [Escherichia coli]|uniref:Putative lytic transglycosylase, catalytic n=1 Tax=Escherichia coli TaxID=562 RepID=A0A377BG33_ECOLX|nr:putative lytic transglycosylase, catalytic [Escherichia coli]
MARQLMLYGDRGNNTLDGIIHTYAPQSENNTRAYIDSVSKSTGFGAQQRINLHDPDVLKH